MMFNFDEKIDRTNSDSCKWKKYANKNIIPLWIADTDFRSPPCVIEALLKRINHGIFGYGVHSEELVSIFIERMYKLYKWRVNHEWIIFLPGLVSGLYLAVRSVNMTNNSAVILPYPIYPPFINAVQSVGCQYILIPMRLYKQRWCINFLDKNIKLSGYEKILMLCNPHNPGGTSYRHDELLACLSFAQKNNLIVCSDEIHCDFLLDPNIIHIPFASLNEDAEQRSIILMSPSKAFNIAGLGASVAVIANKHLRKNFIKQRIGIVPTVDILALIAASAAWKYGQSWFNQQLNYLRNNLYCLKERIKNMRGLKLFGPEATYLAWIDASGLNIDNPHSFFEQAGVGLSAGKEFGNRQFVRLNFGCTKNLLNKALDRMTIACNK